LPAAVIVHRGTHTPIDSKSLPDVPLIDTANGCPALVKVL
jgi:hypothetical protein